MSQDDPICITSTDDEFGNDGYDMEQGGEQSGGLSDEEGLSAHSIERRRRIRHRSNDDSIEESKYNDSQLSGEIECEKPSKGHKDPFHGKRFRWWFFTWNNPEHPDNKSSLLKDNKFQYIKFQYEIGKEGTRHYQGVLYLKNACTCSALTKRYPSCGYFAPVKDIKGACNYCGKEESRLEGPWEAGTLPNQGRRSDLLECKAIIDGGGTLADLFEEQFANTVRYGRGLKEYYNLKHKDDKRTWQTICYVYYGDSGMGKTEAAKIESEEWGGDTFWLTLEGGTFGKVWWDGYDGEENVIIDEFNCQIRLADFKRLIDSSPLKVPVKGGMVPFLAKRIWIMSNKMIDAWYYKCAPPGPERNALNRRLHYKEEFMERFQGQINYKKFVDIRRSFVHAQQCGDYVVRT